MPSLPNIRALANPRALAVRRAAIGNPRTLVNIRGADGPVSAFDPLSLTSLVALYDPDTFGKGTPDTSGNGRDALFQGTVWPVWSPFNVGDKPNSLYFDGVTRTVATNCAANLGATGTGVSGPFCIEGQFKKGRAATVEAVVGRWGSTVPSQNFQILNYSDGKTYGQFYDGTATYRDLSGASGVAGAVVDFSLDYDGTTWRFFLNGTLAGSLAAGIQNADGVTPMRIGTSGDAGGYPFMGSLRWMCLSNVSRHTANYVPSIPANTDANTLVLIKNGSVIAAPDATAISSLGDLSGQGNHLYQATGAAQPVWKAAIRNGHSVLRFAGAQNMDAANTDYAQPNSAFVAGMQSGSTGMFLASATAGKGNDLFWYPVDGKVYVNAGTNLSGSVIASGTWHSMAGVFDGASSSNNVDGVSVPGAAGAFSTGLIRIGNDQPGSNPMTGDMGLTAIQHSHSTPSEIAAMMAYLKARYNTP